MRTLRRTLPRLASALAAAAVAFGFFAQSASAAPPVPASVAQPAAAPAPTPVVAPTAAVAQTAAPIGGPVAQATPPADPGGVIGNVVQTIQNIWQVSTYLPEKTFRRAIEKAVRGIAQNTITETQEALVGVIDATIFNGMMVVGAAQLPDAIRDIGDWMARAAVPLWAISLAVMGVAVMTRNAVGLGYGSNDAAYEFVRWALIALASGNGFVLVNLAHGAFGALQATLLGGAGASAGSIVEALLPGYLLAPNVSIVFLLIALIVAFITVMVMIVAWVARFLLLSSVAGLAPLAIATEGIPFLRFVFRDWLGMFVKLELVGVLNAFIFVMMAALGGLFAPGGGVFGALLGIVMMVGLASAIIGINWSVFNQVFGTAVAVAEQAKTAASQIMGVLAFAGGAVATGGASALTSAEGAGAAMSGMGSALGSNVLRSAGAGIRQGSTYGSAFSSSSADTDSASTKRALTVADRRRAFEARQAAEGDTRGAGASAAHESADVLGARTKLAARFGEGGTTRAFEAASPTLGAMSKAFGNLTRAAKRSGYSTAGELAGAVTEDIAERQAGPGIGPRAFGESFSARLSAHNPGTPREEWIQPSDFGVGLRVGMALGQPQAAPEFANAAFLARTNAEDIGNVIELAEASGQAHAAPRDAERAFRAALPGVSPSASSVLPPMADASQGVV